MQGEATEVGGEVHTLLGNHEVMNLEGQYHYVAKSELQRLIKDLEPESLDPDQQHQQSLRLWTRLLQPVGPGFFETALFSPSKITIE